MKFFFVLVLFIQALFGFHVNISNRDVANGQTIFVELDKEKGVKFQNIELKDEVFRIFEHPLDSTKVYTIIPINYYTKADKGILKLLYTKDKKQFVEAFNLNIKDGNYEKEKIVVDPNKVNPKSKTVLRRISTEYNEAMKVYNNVSNENFISKPFILPMNSKITSDFGKARLYNNSLKGYHSGTDFRAPVGTPIECSNDGKVVLVKQRFYSGGTVVVDHGRGIYTCYFHMSKFAVQKNQYVKRGQILGLSGQSGRVTGPHLHFAARVHGVQVDPLQLIALLNSNLLHVQTIANK